MGQRIVGLALGALACFIVAAAPAAADFGPPELRSDRAQPGADANLPVQSAGLSRDGTRNFFLTSERILPADNDNAVDLYQRFNGFTTLLSDRIQPGADQALNVGGVRVTDDGTRAFFLTNERLVADDGDSATDVYLRTGNTTTLVSDRTTGADQNKPATLGGFSANGSRVFFSTAESLIDGDGDATTDVYQRYNGSTTLLSDRVQPGPDNETPAVFRGSSSDGGRVFFVTAEDIISSDDDSARDVYQRSGTTTRLLSDRIRDNADDETAAFFEGSSADGTHVFFSTAESLLEDDGDGSSDVYERASATVTRLISDRVQAGADEVGDALFDGSSTDGNRVFFSTAEPILGTDGDNTLDVYQRSNGTTTTLLSDRIQSGADGNFPASFRRASTDGSRVFFHTDEAILADDTDPDVQDVYQRVPGSTSLISDRIQDRQDGEFSAFLLGISSDGSRAFFQTFEQLLSDDQDEDVDIYERSAGATSFVTVPGPGSPSFIGNGADGNTLYFSIDDALVDADGDSTSDIYVTRNGP
jgi:hypothetical protein